MELIKVRHLAVGQRLSDISLELHGGEMVGVLGANGAGKSTLLHCLAGLEACQGDIFLQGKPLSAIPERQRAQWLGFLPQHSECAWALTVRDIISLGRLPWGDANPEAIAGAAAATGVDGWLERSVDRLSGGEQARVWLARVLAGQPQVLLADEPVASLDMRQQQHVLRLLQQYARSGNGVMLSIHDLSLAARYCDRLYLLHEGRLVAQGTPQQVLTGDNLLLAFGVETRIDLQGTPPVIVPR